MERARITAPAQTSFVERLQFITEYFLTVLDIHANSTLQTIVVFSSA